MTVKERTTELRYQVRADFTDGETDYLVNSYSRQYTADHTAKVLNRNIPKSYIARAWVVDTGK